MCHFFACRFSSLEGFEAYTYTPEVAAWNTTTLWKTTVFDVPFMRSIDECLPLILDMVNTEYDEDDWDRVAKADLSYPIIVLGAYGIADGCHRIVRAYLDGLENIKCVRVHLHKPEITFETWADYYQYVDNT